MMNLTSIRGKQSVKDVAEILGASKFTLYRHIKSGLIPSFRLGRKVLLDVDEVLAVLRQEGELRKLQNPKA